MKLLNPQTKVVLCTACTDYAVEGFDLNVFDYLLKPISLERFLQCVRKSDTQTQTPSRNKSAGSDSNHIFVKTHFKNNYMKVNLNEILFVEGMGNYLKIQLSEGRVVCQLTMKTMEEQLQEHGFTQVHKSFIVAIHKITQVQGNSIHPDKRIIPVGANYREPLFNLLKERTTIKNQCLRYRPCGLPVEVLVPLVHEIAF